MKKLICILLTVAMMLVMMTSVFALPDGLDVNTNVTMGETLTGKVNKVLGGIQWAGYAIAIGMLLYIGIKYIMSAANEKADLKKGLINYVIGAAILVGASTILGAIITFMGPEGSATDADKNKEKETEKKETAIIYQLEEDFYA